MHFYNHIDLKGLKLLVKSFRSPSSKCLRALLKKVWIFCAKKCHYVHAKACPGSVLRIPMFSLCGLVNNRVKASELCKLKIHCLKGDSYQKKGCHCPSQLCLDGGHFCTWRIFGWHELFHNTSQFTHMWNSNFAQVLSATKKMIWIRGHT